MALLKVEVVYARAGSEDAVTVLLPPRSTAADALAASRIAERHPEIGLAPQKLGIFGKRVPAGAVLSDGDRVEIYRPLFIDPKEARRRRARRAR